MMKAAPAASLIVSEPDLLLELLIVALDAPAQFGEIDQLAEADLLRQGREPVFGRFFFALRPLDQQPLLRSGSPRRPLVGGLPPRFGLVPDGHTKVFD